MPVDSPRYRPASPHAYTAPLPAWPAIRGAGVGAEVATNLMAAFVGMGDTGMGVVRDRAAFEAWCGGPGGGADADAVLGRN